MIDQEKFAELVQKYLDGEATPAEKAFLEAYYDAHESGRPLSTLLDNEQANALKADMFRNIQSGIKVRPIRTRQRVMRYAAVAAGLLLLISAGFLLRDRGGLSPDRQTAAAMHLIQADTLRKITLSDGTLVWLNAESKLQYPADFGQRQRDIYLEGEAYFEVKSDVERPFMVHTQGLTTRVLGTKFNVKAYDAKAIEVTLVEGKVMLTAPRASAQPGTGAMDTLFLTPNEKAVYVMDRLHTGHTVDQPLAHGPSASGVTTAGKALLSKREVTNALESTLWRSGELVFDQEPLGRVLDAFNRKLHVTIKAAPELLEQPVSLRITTESVDEVLFQITRQVKRDKMNGGRKVKESTQYKKQGSAYYIE